MIKKIWIRKLYKHLAIKFNLSIRFKVNKILATSDVIPLHIGCGTLYKEGWINIDNNSDHNIQNLDINYNLAHGIPFPDNSVDYIYHEHFIEHLSLDEGLSFLKECHRVLKKGATMRIACPDLDQLIQHYINNNWQQQDWVTKYQCEWIKTRCQMINTCMNQEPWGHKYVYNREELKLRLTQSGFRESDIIEAKYGLSNHLKLNNIDTRKDSMFFEITKN